VTDVVVSLEYYHAVASTVGATGKPQLVLCSERFSQSNRWIECWLYEDSLYQKMLILNHDCWSYLKVKQGSGLF